MESKDIVNTACTCSKPVIWKVDIGRGTPVQDGDSDVDGAGSDSVDGLNITVVDDEEYCPSLSEAQGYDSGDDSEDDELHCRKRRRVSPSPQPRLAIPPPVLGALARDDR
jgi:hypothetical protein